MSLLFVLMLSLSVDLRSTGGYGGRGTGNITVSSNGQVHGIWNCGGKLAEAQMRAVEAAVAAARPAAWQPKYDNESIVYDDVHFRLSLTVDGRRYDTAWRGTTRGMLPKDLTALHQALRQALKAVPSPACARGWREAPGEGPVACCPLPVRRRSS